MIRGGVEYGLGIFITGVDPESAAHKAGLQIGDQILEVNGESFLAVTHDTAVNVLKYSRRLRLALRRVDKVPHSCTTYDRRCWPSTGQSNGNISAENMEATLAMIEEKSQRMLTRASHERLREVVGDYAAGRIPIEHLLIIAREILDSPDKMSLLTELREVVRLEDQDKFDAAVFRHDPIPQEKTAEGYGGQVSNLDDFIEMFNQMELNRVGDEEEEEEEEEVVRRSDQRVAEVSLGLREIAKTPSEDSGVEMSNGAFLHRREVARSLSDRKRTGFLLRENGATIEGLTWADAEITESEYQLKRDRENRRSVGSKREKILQKRYSERVLAQTEEVSHNIKPQRRHSLAPSSTRIRDEYNQSLPPPTGPSSVSRGGRDDYDPPPPSSRVRDDYESSPRGRGPTGIGGDDYVARLRDEYDPLLQPPPSARSLAEGYDPLLPGSEFDVPSVRVHDDYHHLQQVGSAHDSYDVAPQEAYDMKPLGKGHSDYGALPGRDVYEGSPSRTHLTVDHRPGCGSGGGSSPCSSPVGGGSLGGGGRRGSSEKQDELHPPYACRSRRTSLVVSDSQGRFRVVVKKTRPNLGIAIEGGADTKQRLPRVINIAANGAAFEAGGLRVGQLIIAVDGQKLDGHSHEEAARLIASCWVSRSRPEVEFMVVERKPTAADVRRSSISLLSQM